MTSRIPNNPNLLFMTWVLEISRNGHSSVSTLSQQNFLFLFWFFSFQSKISFRKSEISFKFCWGFLQNYHKIKHDCVPKINESLVCYVWLRMSVVLGRWNKDVSQSVVTFVNKDPHGHTYAMINSQMFSMFFTYLSRFKFNTQTS